MQVSTDTLNHAFGLGKVEDGIAAEVTVGAEGRIRLGALLGDTEVTQAEAADIAEKLVAAIEASVNRNQIGSPRFYDSAEILRRSEGKLGRAKAAVHAIYHSVS